MKEVSFVKLLDGTPNVGKTLNFFTINKKFYIRSRFANSLYIKNNLIVSKYWHVNKHNAVYYREYGPAVINFFICQWFSNHGEEITDDVNDWLDSKNIVLSKDNDYEIPDEHKIEFRLRFM